MFNAISPAAGVKVLPAPRGTKIVFDSYAQQKGSKIMAPEMGVIRCPKKVVAEPLGMPSTVRTCPTKIIATPGGKKCGPTSNRRPRGHSHRPSNMSFSAPMRSDLSYRTELGKKLLRKVLRQHLMIITRRTTQEYQNQYMHNLRALKNQHPILMPEFHRVVAAHNATMVKPWKKNAA